MSNLKLPKLTFANMQSTLKTAKPNPYGMRGKSIGYATGVAGNERTIFIIHHTTTIVSLWDDGGVRISNGGYGTPTTRNRIHKALADNFSGWAVTQRNFVQILVNYQTGQEFPYFQSARFDSEGTLVEFNDVSLNSPVPVAPVPVS